MTKTTFNANPGDIVQVEIITNGDPWTVLPKDHLARTVKDVSWDETVFKPLCGTGKNVDFTVIDGDNADRSLCLSCIKLANPMDDVPDVWSSACPPGGYVCGACGMPTESEPCREHQPNKYQAGQ